MPNRKALLVGVGDYIELPKLRTPANNLDRLQAILKHENLGGFTLFSEQVYLNLVASEFQKVISDFFKSAEADDLLLLYYVGHGMADYEDPSNLFLSGIDSSLAEPDINSISKDFIIRRINRSNASKLILIFDCCYSGRFTKSLQLNRSEQAIDILTSTASTSYAFEPTEAAESNYTYFTEALIEGIEQGEAGNNNSDKIYTGDIFNFIQERIEGKGLGQLPQSYSNTQMGSLFIARNPLLHQIAPSALRKIGSADPADRKAGVEYLAKHFYGTSNENFAKLLLTHLQRLARDSDKDVAEQAHLALKKQIIEPSLGEASTALPFNTIGSAYMRWLLQLHSYLRLHGIQAAKDFKGVRLEQVYVALRGDKASSYERMKAKERVRTYIIDQLGIASFDQLDERIQYDLELDFITQAPVMPSIAQRDKSNSNFEIPITLGEAFREERFLVILGDPGSGKSTLAKWLVIKLATAFLKQLSTGEAQRVQVPESQIDPYLDQSALYDLGPARFPVLLSISDYSQVFQERKIPLVDYLGEQKWEDYRPRYSSEENIPEDHLKQTIIHFLRQGEAVIILDGLDEVTINRKEIVLQVEEFIRDWIIFKGETSKVLQEELEWQDFNTPPGIHGGNQIVITSRIVGYHLARINNNIQHVVIESMSRQAISRFCRVWMETAYQADQQHFPDSSAVALTAKREAEKLEEAIFSDKRVLELASNPLIITILALVFRNNNGVLPPQRAALYQEAMRTLVESWKKTNLTLLEVEYVLSAVASQIHMNHSKGLIKGVELREIIWDNLVEFRRLKPHEIPVSFEAEVDAFIAEINNKVGIIAPRGHEAYSFLHLTFQEYLAARFITKDKGQAAEYIIRYMDNPRWKVPLLMSLGHISVDPSWGPQYIEKLLDHILLDNGRMGTLFPRTALFLAEGLVEMSLEKVNDHIIEKVALELLRFYNTKGRIEVYPQIRAQIERAIQALRKSEKGSVIDELFSKILSGNNPEMRELIGLSAKIIYDNRWFSKAIVRQLFEALQYDQPGWDWVITNSLIKLASDNIRFDEPKEPVPPDTPQSRYEKALRFKVEELNDLLEGKLEVRLKQEAEVLKQKLPVLVLKKELHEEAAKRKEYTERIEHNYATLDQVFNGELRKVLENDHHRLKLKLQELKRGSSGLMWRIHKYEKALASIETGIAHLESGYYTEIIHKEISLLSEALSQTNQRHQALEEELKALIDSEAYNELIQEILKPSEENKTKGENNGKETDTNLRFLSRLETPNHTLKDQLSSWQEQLITSSGEQYLETLKQLEGLQQRLQRIQAGSEKQFILQEIETMRETIRKRDFSFELYREEKRRFDLALRYFEEGLDKYDNSEVHAFEDYDLPFGNLALPADFIDSESGNVEHFTPLLIIISLLGGYRNMSQLEVSLMYEDMATMLSMPDAERKVFLEQNAQSSFGRFGYTDAIYGAAVQLDTKRINIQDHVTVALQTKSSPVFSEQYFYRKSHLPTSVLQKFMSGDSDEEIRRQLDLILAVSTKEEERLDATIASIFLQKNSLSVLTLIDQSNQKAQLCQQFGLIRNVCKEPIFQSINLYLNKLRDLSSNIPAYQWVELYRFIFQTITRAYGRPLIRWQFLEVVPDGYFAYVLANLWYNHCTIYMDDRSDSIQKILDVNPDYRPTPVGVRNALIEISETPLFELRKELGHTDLWEVNTYIDYSIFRANEIPYDAFLALENFHLLEDIPNSINHQFKTTFLRQLIDIQGEEQGQRLEVYLFCLQNRLFDNGLEEYLPKDLRLPGYLENKLFPKILRIGDRYFACRALLQYLPYAGLKRKKVIVKLLRWAPKIKSGFERAQILCRLFYVLQDRDQIAKVTRQLLATLDKLTEPFQRLKILVDHHEFILDIAPERFQHWLAGDVLLIPWPYDRARVIRTLLKQEWLSANLKERLIEQAKQFDSPFMSGVALDLLGSELLFDQTFGLKGHRDWAPLLIYGAFGQLLRFFESKELSNSGQDKIAVLWRDLERNPSRESVNELLVLGVEDGLRLNSLVVETIETFLSRGQINTLLPLLPLLNTPSTALIPRIRTWLQRNDSIIRDYAALYLSEFDAVRADTIEGVLRLASGGHSKALYRANIVLSRGVTKVDRFPLPHQLSQLDQKLLNAVVSYIMYERNLRAQTQAFYFLYDVNADSFSSLKKLLDSIYQEDGYQETALMILKYIGAIPPEVEASLADFLQESGIPSELEQALILQVIMAYNNYEQGNSEIFYKLLGVLVNQIPERLKQYTFFARGAFDLIDVLEREAKNLEVHTESLDQAASELTSSIYEVFSKPYEEVRNQLANGLYPAVGLFYTGRYYFKYARELEHVQEVYTDKKFEAVISWLFLLEKKQKAPDKFLEIRRELLLVILAIWTNERNISLLNSKNEQSQLYHLFLRLLSDGQLKYIGRIAILRLAKFIENHSVEGIQIFADYLQMGLEYREAAMQIFENLKYVDETLVDFIIEELHQSNTQIAFYYVQILTNYAKDETIKPEVRNRIIEAFVKAIDDPELKQGVYFYLGDGSQQSPYKPEHLNRLDLAIFDALLQVCGII